MAINQLTQSETQTVSGGFGYFNYGPISWYQIGYGGGYHGGGHHGGGHGGGCIPAPRPCTPPPPPPCGSCSPSNHDH